jgi:hypothetical protein
VAVYGENTSGPPLGTSPLDIPLWVPLPADVVNA